MPTGKCGPSHKQNSFIDGHLNILLTSVSALINQNTESIWRKSFLKSQLLTIEIRFVLFFFPFLLQKGFFFAPATALNPSRANSMQQQTTAVRLGFCLLSELNWLSDTSQKQQTKHKGRHRNIPLQEAANCQSHLQQKHSDSPVTPLQQEAASHLQQAGG